MLGLTGTMTKWNGEKLSAVFKEMAATLFVDPSRIPSSEAAHAALLLVHVAWNREVGGPLLGQYQQVLGVFERSRPDFWSELRSHDCEALIDALRLLKRRRYSEDRRQVLVCGMKGANVHVEWTD
ncbi:MAG: hypothetical protein L0312_31480 [Acidobacteria bacterium]|nr:hypothetical protein [Acidobacteriota bacterium]